MTDKRVIVNGDDLGLSHSVNTAIASCFESGFISSSTMLANGEAFKAAVCIAKDKGFCDKIGIHFNLTHGKPITREIANLTMFCENGIFHGNTNRLRALNPTEKNAVYKELKAQAEKILSSGIKIDHADSHHHIHTAVFIAPIVFEICKEFGICKIRLNRNIGKIRPYKKAFKRIYNDNLKCKGFKTTDYFGGLIDIEDGVPDNIEIMVHPDYDKDGLLIDRRGFIDGFPTGVSLYSIGDKYGARLISYGDL